MADQKSNSRIIIFIILVALGGFYFFKRTSRPNLNSEAVSDTPTDEDMIATPNLKTQSQNVKIGTHGTSTPSKEIEPTPAQSKPYQAIVPLTTLPVEKFPELNSYIWYASTVFQDDDTSENALKKKLSLLEEMHPYNETKLIDFKKDDRIHLQGHFLNDIKFKNINEGMHLVFQNRAILKSLSSNILNKSLPICVLNLNRPSPDYEGHIKDFRFLKIENTVFPIEIYPGFSGVRILVNPEASKSDAPVKSIDCLISKGSKTDLSYRDLTFIDLLATIGAGGKYSPAAAQ